MDEEKIQIIPEIIKFLVRHKNETVVLFIVLAIFDVIVLFFVFSPRAEANGTKIYFLDVGQGDSELVILQSGVKILIDGGPPNGRALKEIGNILSPMDRYIDIVMLSHPQLDHFGGLIDVLKRYRVGAFVSNGVSGESDSFLTLTDTLKKNNIREISLARGDKIKNGEDSMTIFHPKGMDFEYKELNESTLIAFLETNLGSALFTGDINVKIEKEIFSFISVPVNILKVAHHGSKFASSDDFISSLKPALAVIEVGKNSYGHPTQEVLSRLKNAGASIYRTDKDGTIEAIINDGKINVFKF